MQYTLDNFTEWSPSLNGASESTLERQLDMFVEILQAQAGGPRGYRLRRIMLTNFWLYGLQEFEIPHGRLFLAGENASGKSTVLTAALPLALDGDLRPNRIDTFGGRERRIEYYVLGSNDSATPYSHERRTAYIALEFEWCDPEQPPIAQELAQRLETEPTVWGQHAGGKQSLGYVGGGATTGVRGPMGSVAVRPSGIVGPLGADGGGERLGRGRRGVELKRGRWAGCDCMRAEVRGN